MARLRFGAPSFRECSTNNRKRRIPSASTMGMWLSVSLAGFVGMAWPQDPAAGILPFSTQAVGIYDSVDLATSNINVTIPVRNKQGKIPFSYSLVGNSHSYIYACGSGCVPPQPAQWRGGFGLLGQVSVGANVGFTSTSKEVTCSNLNVNALQLSSFYITDSTGAIHPLTIGPILMNTPQPCYGGGSGGGVTLGTTSDGSFYTLVEFPYTYVSGGTTYDAGTFTIYDKSGNAYEPGYGPLLSSYPGIIIQDPDGAQISYTSTVQSGNTVQNYTDTLGEQVITYSYNGTQSTSQYKDAGNNTQTFQVNMSSYTVQTNFACSNVTDIAPTSVSLDSSITLPIGTISFTYEVTPR
jgi:hypothetical protein